MRHTLSVHRKEACKRKAAQVRQHGFGAEPRPEGGDLRRHALEQLREQPDDDGEQAADAFGPPPDPAPLGLAVGDVVARAGLAHRFLHARRSHGRPDLVKCPRRPRRHAVRKLAERCVRVPAAPARHPRGGRGLAPVGAVTPQGAATLGMVRADIQSGVAPGFRANVFPGGRLRFVSDLQLPVHSPGEEPFARATPFLVRRINLPVRMLPEKACREDLLGKGLCRERGSAEARLRLPTLSRKSGNPCRKQSGKNLARRIGLNRETAPLAPVQDA